MNELPPVRKTLSISSTDTLSRCNSWSTVCSIRAISSAIQRSKILTRDLLFDMELAEPENEIRGQHRREPHLRVRNGTVYAETPIIADDLDKLRDLLGR
jgi:hypothetical protein